MVDWLSRLGAILRDWHERRRGVAVLATLDDYRLRDIALTRAEVQNEIKKFIWL